MINTLDDIQGISVTIMGLGLNGGGLASARFFAENGADVLVTDLKTEQELAPSLADLQHYPNMRFVLGQHRIEDFSRADLVIKNPGVKYTGNPYLAAARAIETDISIFLRLSKAPIIAVTGSKGKSSTVSAIHYGLQGCGFQSFLGGNITVSPLSFLSDTDSTTPVVLELSSWQLGDLQNHSELHPRIAVLTPIMPDHQNWYGSMERYVADKKIIYQNQTAVDYTICNYDDPWGKQFAAETQAHVYWYSVHPLPTGYCGVWIAEDGTARFRQHSGKEYFILPQELAVPGQIMKQNIAAAALALALYGADIAKIPPLLAQYHGIPHRLEYFHQKGAVRFYNDSAATIPEAAAAAISAFDEPVILITGGTDKQLDFSPLIPHLTRVKELYLLAGTATDKLLPMLHEAGIPYYGVFNGLPPLLEKLHANLRLTEKQAVVFSPASASFGMFKNEFDRGAQFKSAVESYW